jgi:hypothetical protein
MPFTDYLGTQWRVARVADIPFPTSLGGNTTGCPLDDICKRAYAEKGENVTSKEVIAALTARQPEIRKCWHHRLTRAEHLYIAELSCWFVEHEVQPYPDSFAPVVKRDGFSVEVQYAAQELFEYPLHWSFIKGEALGNGRHRLCALKANKIPRVAVEI